MSHLTHTNLKILNSPQRSPRQRKLFKKPLMFGLAVLSACALIAAACGSDDDDAATTTTAAPADTQVPATAAPDASPAPTADPAEAAPVALSDVCPATIKVLTDWFPEPEHNYLYQLIGVNGEVDAANGTYSGPIGDGTVEMIIQSGGPYINFNSQTTQFYSDPSIFMAFVDTSEAIKSHVNTPVVAVFTNFEVGPQILMWDPEVYDFETFEDIGNSGATVLYFGGASYMDYLLSLGVLDVANVDGTYDGSPGRFSTEGDLVQQGFATNEPYRYENEIESWMKPVDFLLIHDSGHDTYQSALSVRPESITEDAACLDRMVPMFQQALADYMAEPGPINVRLDEIVTELDSTWTASVETHNAASEAMRNLGLMTDGPNGYVGDMDEARIQALIEKLTPAFTDQGVEGFAGGSPDLEASDIFTNQFLDTSIGLGF